MLITLFEGMVLDGWHRQQACLQTGVEASYVEFAGDGAAARRFVISANRMRRHLSTSQLAMVAATLATLAHGGDRKSQNQGANLPLDRSSIKDAAELLKVSPRSVKHALVVQNSGRPEIVEKVNQGDLAVSRAAKEVREAQVIHMNVKPSHPEDDPRPVVDDLLTRVRKEAFADLARMRARLGYSGLQPALAPIWQAFDDAQLAEAKRTNDRATIQDVEDARFSRSLDSLQAAWQAALQDAPEEALVEFIQDALRQLTPEMRANVFRLAERMAEFAS